MRGFNGLRKWANSLVLLSQKVAVSGLRESVKLHVSERAEHGSTTVIR